MEFAPHDFMMALTGLAATQALKTDVRGLDVVGKVKITERRSIEFPENSFESRDKLEAWLMEHAAEDGWIVNPYLGSQGSRSSPGGACEWLGRKRGG